METQTGLNRPGVMASDSEPEDVGAEVIPEHVEKLAKSFAATPKLREAFGRLNS